MTPGAVGVPHLIPKESRRARIRRADGISAPGHGGFLLNRSHTRRITATTLPMMRAPVPSMGE